MDPCPSLSGEDRQIGLALACAPAFLAWPPIGPPRIDEAVRRRCLRRRPEFDEVEDLEPVRPQESYPVAVAEVELDGRVVRPLEAVHAELGSTERRRGRRPVLAGTQSMRSVLLPRKTSSPPGRSSRDASGIQAQGSAQMAAPYSLMTSSNEPSAQGTCSLEAGTRGNDSPNSAWNWRAIASWPAEGSTPTGSAPSRASHADTYAVPQPSSSARLPLSSSGRRGISRSGTPKIPQLGSLAVHPRRAVAI